MTHNDRFQVVRMGDIPKQDPKDERLAVIDTHRAYDEQVLGCEPEDQTLRRDWSWVVPTLNKLATETEKLLLLTKLARDQWQSRAVAAETELARVRKLVDDAEVADLRRALALHDCD